MNIGNYDHWLWGMKWLILILPTTTYSQKVFSVKYESQSDVKVFVVDYESQCDLKV